MSFLLWNSLLEGSRGSSSREEGWIQPEGVCGVCLRRGYVWGVSEEGDILGVSEEGDILGVSEEGMCVGCV